MQSKSSDSRQNKAVNKRHPQEPYWLIHHNPTYSHVLHHSWQFFPFVWLKSYHLYTIFNLITMYFTLLDNLAPFSNLNHSSGQKLHFSGSLQPRSLIWTKIMPQSCNLDHIQTEMTGFGAAMSRQKSDIWDPGSKGIIRGSPRAYPCQSLVVTRTWP